MAVKKYIVTVDDATPSRMRELAEDLRQAGFEVAQQLEAAGVIVGSAEEAAVPRIRALRGVAGIEEERSYRLPPPESNTM